MRIATSSVNLDAQFSTHTISESLSQQLYQRPDLQREVNTFTHQEEAASGHTTFSETSQNGRSLTLATGSIQRSALNVSIQETREQSQSQDQDTVIISPEGQKRAADLERFKQGVEAIRNNSVPANPISRSSDQDFRLRIMLRLLQQITGKEITLPGDFSTNTSTPTTGAGYTVIQVNISPATNNDSNANASAPVVGTVTETRADLRQETESLQFKASGTVQTAEGKTIDFAMRVSLSKDSETLSQSKSVSAWKDPLAISFGSGATQLTDKKYDFDLNGDGQAEKMSMATGSSALLVLDKNGDGKINNGKEMFGATSGDGFAELAAYDQDKNGWIDENDAVFSKLQLMSKSSTGQDKLMSLSERGVGAIYLGRTEVEYVLSDRSDNPQAKIRAMGVALLENGGIASVQRLDMAV